MDYCIEILFWVKKDFVDVLDVAVTGLQILRDVDTTGLTIVYRPSTTHETGMATGLTDEIPPNGSPYRIPDWARDVLVVATCVPLEARAGT